MEDFVEHRIYEKNDKVAGTWLENTYPGVACDVPAHIYCFLFEPNPNWSKFYAPGHEIREYIERTAAKYDLAKNITFHSRVTETIWDDPAGKWRLKVENTQTGEVFEDECDIFVDCTGVLHHAIMPEIPGIDAFKGHLVHTARWDSSYDYVGKKVGIIGNGSSGIQVLPPMQKTVGDSGHVYNFIRSPTWITVGNLAHLTPTKDGQNFEYSEAQKSLFASDPIALRDYRRDMENRFDRGLEMYFKGSKMQAALLHHTRKDMARKLKGNPELLKAMTPSFDIGCRRLTPGPGYLEAIQEPNCTPIFDKIKEIKENGLLLESGIFMKLDAIICATGFDVSGRPRWRTSGKDGKSLEKMWEHVPEGYLGICAPYMPNYFKFGGPNAPVSHGGLLPVMSDVADYVCKWVSKIAREDIRTATVKPEVVSDWNVYAQEFLKRTSWSGSCSSWYKNHQTDGPVTAMYPGSQIHHREFTQDVRGEDFNIEYRSANRFRFFGDGFTKREKEGGNLAWYMEK
ncbi:hypothetical protein BZA05DRAFT_430466 [Tricharina praecox]|uniref:uncharacterized protein n=1 Tax=Tricharina praecox TaxID=43433 RepID=UPI00221E73BB|nr:uncharacterized protein BZA05DRAFT_430466 [Tricharina praecox]KAI5850754.1 hypothetical protein BZA05DRAFT_430466 [Tricharina praecox]